MAHVPGQCKGPFSTFFQGPARPIGEGGSGAIGSLGAQHIGEIEVALTREELFQRLDALGIVTSTTEHAATFTVAESGAIHDSMPGAHTKNLFVKDPDGRMLLIVANVETRVDLKLVAKQAGVGRLSFGKPELLTDILGVTPGSVTAFAIANDAAKRVTIVLDRALMSHGSLNCHPLENTATTNIARDDLLRFIRATGHEPIILALTE